METGSEGVRNASSSTLHASSFTKKARCRLRSSASVPEASTHSPFPFGSGVRGGGDPGRGWRLASQRRCCCEKQRHCLQASVCRLLAGSCLQAPRSHSVAVYEVVGIRAEAGSLRPNEGVAAQGSISLVVFRAKHGRRRLTVLFVTLGSQCVPIVCALRFTAIQVTESALRACGPLYEWRQPLRGGCRGASAAPVF